MPLLEQLMPGVGRLLEKGRFPEERRIAICVMDDIIEHAPQGAAKYMAQVCVCGVVVLLGSAPHAVGAALRGGHMVQVGRAGVSMFGIG